MVAILSWGRWVNLFKSSGTVWSHLHSISFPQTADDRHFYVFQPLSMLYICCHFDVCKIVICLTLSPWNLTLPYWHTTLSLVCSWFNTLRPRGSRHHLADDIFKYIFLNENVWILINILLKFIPKGPINNIPALVQMMAWRRPRQQAIIWTDKNIERHTAHTILSWPNPKQWRIVHTSNLMMIIRQSLLSQSSQGRWVNWKRTVPYIV